MVKTPRTRHSKTEKEPVTIDLAPGEVSRVKAEAERTAASPGADSASASPDDPKVAPEAKGADAAPTDAVRAETAKQAGVGTRTDSASVTKEAGPGMSASDAPGSKPTSDDQVKPKPATDGPATAGASATRDQAKAAQGSPSTGPAFGRKDQPAPPPRPASRRGGVLAGGIAGGAVALLVAGGLGYAGLLPGAGRTVQDNSAVAALEAQVAELRSQLEALGAASGGDAALDGRVTDAEERVAALASELDTLRGEVSALGSGELGSAPAVDLGPLEERIAAVESTLAALDNGEGAGGASGEALGAVEEQVSTLREAIAALRTTADQTAGEVAAMREDVTATRTAQTSEAARIDALEQAVASLTGRVEEQAEMPGTALIIAASALKAAIDRGLPFATELETYASLAPGAPEIEELRAYASTGVPTRSQIAAESDAAANAMIAAARPVDPQAGVLDRLWASAMGLVQVRPIGMVEGEDVPQVVARLDAAVQAGDYERAIAEFGTLPDAARAAGEAFMARVQARHAADRLVDQALADALKA